MSLACSRSLFFMAFTAGALALGVSYYLEYVVGLKPCGLCLLQRGCLALLLVVYLVASVHGPRRFGSFVYWLLGLSASLGGTVAAWRQVLLQSDPQQQLSLCSPNLEAWFGSMPWGCAVQRLFKGTDDCAEISWTLFDLSIPEWSLLFFVAMLILGIYQLLRHVWIACQGPPSGESSHRAGTGD
ncbi:MULTISPECIES: disulfide bond formation protein B [unclassified Pseudomonas]|uniref:disulfide bond formation protein B n=2 Tax=Pseudomonas TaxID=286 RepID=UPI0019118766|nr:MULTISPECIES: disulfide bond formation protein B [unclassified Pseudomonas]MBK5509223.1 disulfide bond formation protein B [Pseudomonas sp. TH15]MBK5550256.1 disulfide bond formation protein B [Pseudomonas sp. TH03]MEB0228553.1 disulfide bond formation protein B [Pseudomonas sp. 5S1]WPX19724.1 disulfide bond formation protein B [Pseudomonas sp. 10S4]